MNEDRKTVVYTGWAILPCFTLETCDYPEWTKLTCNSVLCWIFEHLFAPFWGGWIKITGVKEVEEDE